MAGQAGDLTKLATLESVRELTGGNRCTDIDLWSLLGAVRGWESREGVNAVSAV